MAVVLSLRWPSVAPEQYDAMRDMVRWEEQAPDGLSMHIAWFEDGVLKVTDVWNSAADFERFFAERLAPAVQEVGLPGEPEVVFLPLHRRFVASGVGGAG